MSFSYGSETIWGQAWQKHHDGRPRSRSNVHRTCAVRDKASKLSERRRQLRNIQPIKDDRRGRKYGAHLFDHLPFFRSCEENKAHAFVSDKTLGQFSKAFQRPALGCVLAGAGEQTNERSVGCVLLL